MSEDFLPVANLGVLRQRAAMIRRIRQFFDDRDFLEVETPLLSHDTVVDRYLHPIGITKSDVTGCQSHLNQKLWLQTSPEFGMKRMVAAGAEAIYQIGKSFRQNEIGKMHNPEFTMLEWYRIGDDMRTGMALLANLIETILDKPTTEKITYDEVFARFVNVDPCESPVSELQRVAQQAGIPVEIPCHEANRDEWLNLILSRLIEPQLGRGRGTIIYDWPVSQAAMAIVREDQRRVAERFELYVDGVELANGYHELLDAEELTKRNSINNRNRLKDGSSLLPEESRLLAAMRNGMPACAGVALGVDRMVMLAVGADSSRDVLAFPIDNA